jgi:hypothetical protein
MDSDILSIVCSYLEWNEFLDIKDSFSLNFNIYVKNCGYIPTLYEICNKKKEYLEIAQYVFKNEENHSTFILTEATTNNHINIVKYLCNNDLYNKNNICICKYIKIASKNGNLELVKYFYDMGESKNCLKHCLEYARMYSHMDIYKFLHNKIYNVCF